jgi:competence protein ComEC
VFVAAGALSWTLRSLDGPGDSLSRYVLAHPGAAYVLEGRVREVPVMLPENTYVRFLLDVDQVWANQEPLLVRGGVQVRWTEPEGVLYSGEQVRVSGPLDLYLGPVNYGVRGFEGYLHGRGVFSEISVRRDAVQRLTSGGWRPRYWASRLRGWEARALRRAVPESAFPFVLAVWLGDRSQYTQRESQRFVDTGTAHILAVSGLHVGLVYVCVAGLLGLLRVRGRTTAVVSILAVFAFALTAGARVSSLRAATMIAVYLTYDLLKREPDVPTALGLSGLLLLSLNPGNLFDAGFLLSFGSVASILLFATPLKELLARWLRMPWWLRGALGTTLSVQLLTLPLVIHYFHVFPLVSPLANLLIVPALTLTLWLCILTTLTAAVFPASALLFGHALAPLVFGIRGLAEGAAAIPWSHVAVVSPTLPAMMLFWLSAGALYLALTRKSRAWIGAVAGLGLAAALVWIPWKAPAVVDFLDVGHADAAFVRTPGGTTLLIDGGMKSAFLDSGAQVVAPYLYSNGVRRLDYVVATHPESDHMGGLFEVVERFPVGAAILGPAPTERPLERDFLSLCARRGVPVIRVSAGERLAVAGAETEVLHPPREWSPEDVNESALVLRIRWPGVSVLFAADVEEDGEARLAQGDCEAAVLKVPHHGSRTSSSAVFLDAVQPAAAVFSTRATRQWGAVGAGVLPRYETRGISIWRTDYHGGIRLSQRGGAWTLRGARLERGYSLEPALAGLVE